MTDRTYTLVLGGGGLKGLAHVGVLRALEEQELKPGRILGSSIGALVAAAWLSGLAARELEQIAIEVRRSDLFRVAHRDMALKRMRAPSLFRGEPLEHFVRGLLGDLGFDELDRELLINTVDLNAGTQVFWGSEGFRDVPVADAVIASCALPGYLPPHQLRGRAYMDGAAVSNFPIRAAASLEHDLVVGVDVGSSGVGRRGLERAGFAAVYARAIELAIETMRNTDLRRWGTPPLVLIQPPVEGIGMFVFDRNAELIDAGYRAATEVLTGGGALPPPSASGIYPKHLYDVRVLRERCIGCGACLVHAPPGLFQLDGDGKAVPSTPRTTLAAAEPGFFVRQCPTSAIAVERATKSPDAA